jgi:hypothetical protein
MQRVRKIESKLKELDVEIAKKEQSRAGIQKMLEAYKSNPKMGNPGDVEPQIGEYSREIVSLNEQREKFKVNFGATTQYKAKIFSKIFSRNDPSRGKNMRGIRI